MLVTDVDSFWQVLDGLTYHNDQNKVERLKSLLFEILLPYHEVMLKDNTIRSSYTLIVWIITVMESGGKIVQLVVKKIWRECVIYGSTVLIAQYLKFRKIAKN